MLHSQMAAVDRLFTPFVETKIPPKATSAGFLI
jgi:hypothetical protein